MRGRQAQLRLLGARKRTWRVDGMASMRSIGAVDRRMTIPGQGDKGASAIHVVEDTNSPAGPTVGADAMHMP